LKTFNINGIPTWSYKKSGVALSEKDDPNHSVEEKALMMERISS
tara:strand:+ start:2996 stop:3127 length:132 start_codon:yes stop_codon:yes gene_type:complete